MVGSSVLITMSNGDKHDVQMTPDELERALRTNARIVRLALRSGDEVWLNPAQIVSASLQDTGRPTVHAV